MEVHSITNEHSNPHLPDVHYLSESCHSSCRTNCLEITLLYNDSTPSKIALSGCPTKEQLTPDRFAHVQCIRDDRKRNNHNNTNEAKYLSNYDKRGAPGVPYSQNGPRPSDIQTAEPFECTCTLGEIFVPVFTVLAQCRVPA